MSGAKKTLSPFGTSRPQARISEQSAVADPNRVTKKRKHGDGDGDGQVRTASPEDGDGQVRTARPEDYQEFSQLVAKELPTESSPEALTKQIGELGVRIQDAEELAKQACAVGDRLEQRGFKKPVPLVAVLCLPANGKGDPGEKRAKLAGQLQGIYFEMSQQFNGRPCFQRIVLAHRPTFSCGIYLSWNGTRSRWQIGGLEDEKLGLAYCADNQPGPATLSKPWMLLDATLLT